MRKFFCILLSLCILSPLLFCCPVRAAETGFAATDVLDDLLSSSSNGKPFRLSDYPFDASGSIQVKAFVEYGFSFDKSRRGDYGLYLYIYNPQGLQIVTGSSLNKVQMAVAYDANGSPSRWEKFSLKFLDKSDDANGLFYKFQIADRSIDGTFFADRVNANQRRYDISGVELLTVGAPNATEYMIGGTYKFTGYAAGLGPVPSADSTLNCTVRDTETLTLEVQHTNYRTDQYDKNHYHNVDTVYFMVPERIFRDYGRLQRIHAEWWEYKSAMMAVTSDSAFYEIMDDYKTAYAKPSNSAIPYYLYSEYSAVGGGSPMIHNFGWAFNHYNRTTSSNVYNYSKRSEIMPLVFYSPVVGTEGVFSFLYSDPSAGSVEGNQVADAIFGYPVKPVDGMPGSFVDANGRMLSSALFDPSVDSGRIRGYNDQTVDLGDTFDLVGYQSGPAGWWDKLCDYGFSWPKTHETLKDVQPIYTLTQADLSGTDAEVAARLLVNKDDVPELRSYYASAGNKRVILFRFASTDYYSAPAYRSGYEGHIDSTDTYVAQMTVFLDFDIIDLTFNKDGSYTVIPAVSDPINVINGIDPPAVEFNWFKALLSLLLLVALILLLVPVLPAVIRFFVDLVRIPLSWFRKEATQRKPPSRPKRKSGGKRR